jgi:hypothetical protein
MTSIINKLLGKDDDKHLHGTHSHSHDVKCESGTCSTSTTHSSTGGKAFRAKSDSKSINSSSGGVCEGRTIERDGVNIRSTVSSDSSSTVQLANQQKLNDLVTRLG